MDLINFCLLAVSCCAFVYTLQLIYFNNNRLRGGTTADQTSKSKARLLRIGPAVCMIIAVVATVVVSIRAGSSETCLKDDNTVNPDVGGIGVLLSLFLPCLVLVIVLLLGHFTAENTGPKELCMAQCANLLYLTVNLAKGMSRLNVRELTIAVSSIDAVSASVSMAFSSKDVLAARKLVTFGFLTQLAAFGVEGAVLQKFRPLVNTPCISAMQNLLFREGPSAWAWTYMVLRVIISILPGLVARRLAPDLNEIEHRSTGSRSMHDKNMKLWKSLPATLSTNYWLFCSIVLLHGVSVFAVVRKSNTIGQSWDALKSEWGQSANAIITACAIGHVAYTLAKLFTAEHNGLQTSRISFGQLLLTLGSWSTLRQRWLFDLRLDFSDHLVVDESTLQAVLNPPLEVDPTKLEELWKELMIGFDYNDPTLILDCLIQGAPKDRANENGDYPVHLASRTNDTKILMWTLPNEQDYSRRTQSLLLKNSASETPLEIACDANKLEAVQWIMERLPQGQDNAKAAVCRAFRSCILAEKLDVLRKLKHLWPAWKELTMRTESNEYSPFYYAVAMHKERAADVLLDLKTSQREDPKLWRSYELARTAALPDVMRYILQDIQDKEQTETREKLAYDVLVRQFSDDEALDLLEALKIDLREVLFDTVAAGMRAISAQIPLRRPELWKDLVAETSKLDPFVLDSLVLDSAGFSTHDHLYDGNQILASLIQNGAQDWSKAMEASCLHQFDDLENLIRAESDSFSLRRMLNARDMKGRSILSHTINLSSQDKLDTQQSVSVRYKSLINIIELLLKHGSPITLRDILSTYPQSFEGIGVVIRLMLLAEQQKSVASDALHATCKKLHIFFVDGPECVKRVQILLRSGADPTLKNEYGRTPREEVARLRCGDELWDAMRTASNIVEDVEDMLETEDALAKSCELLRRWEDYHRDPSTGNPSDQPDQDWIEVYDEVVRMTDEHRWAALIAKNPDYKVVREDTTSDEGDTTDEFSEGSEI